MLVIRWLRHKNLLGVERGFDEMMGPNICHNLCSGIDLRVELLLEAGIKLSTNVCILTVSCRTELTGEAPKVVS